MCNHANKKRGVTRRDVLRYSAAGATAVAAMGPLGHLLPAASGAIATQSHMTIMNLFGGNDGINTVIPMIQEPFAVYQQRRQEIAIDPQTAGVHELRDPNTNELKYALHPMLSNIGRLYADGDVAVVNLVGYPNENLSHFTSEDIWSRGVRGNFDDLGIPASGWISRYVDQFSPSPTGAISVGLGRRRDFTGGIEDPLVISSASSFEFDDDGRFRDNSAYRLDVVRQILAQNVSGGSSAEARVAMDQAHALIGQTQVALDEYEQFAGAASYVNESPSRAMQDIARLIHGGFDSRIFYTGFGGFDTHGDQGAGAPDGRHSGLMSRLDNAVGSFEADMKAMNTWNNTCIVVISEFGRRCFENGSDGTDHGHGNCVLVIGGNVNGGLYGPDITDVHMNENWLPGLVDFRDIYREVLTNHLGAADLSSVFPETQEAGIQTMGII